MILQINKFHVIMFTGMQGLLPQLHLSDNNLLNGGICLINFQVPVNRGKMLNSSSFLVLLLIQ